MDIQKLIRLKGKKSKETASGPITKLSADEWNTLVQGVIEHYEDSPYKIDLKNNILTLTDSQGNDYVYELTPYEEAEWQTPTLTIPTTGKINNVNYNLNSIPDSGGDLSITLSYSQNKTKGQTVIDTVTSGGDITYTDLNGNTQTISNHGKTITVTIPQNSDSTTKSFSLTNVKVTVNEKVSTTKTINITQKAYAPDELIIKVLDNYTETEATNLYSNVNASNILTYIPNNKLEGATTYHTYKKDDGASSHSDEYTIDLSTGNPVRIVCVLVKNESSFKYNAIGADFPISDFSSFIVENIPYTYNDVSYYCTLIIQANSDSELKLIINDKQE